MSVEFPSGMSTIHGPNRYVVRLKDIEWRSKSVSLEFEIDYYFMLDDGPPTTLTDWKIFELSNNALWKHHYDDKGKIVRKEKVATVEIRLEQKVITWDPDKTIVLNGIAADTLPLPGNLAKSLIYRHQYPVKF